MKINVLKHVVMYMCYGGGWCEDEDTLRTISHAEILIQLILRLGSENG